MTTKRPAGLGRNLSALLGTSVAQTLATERQKQLSLIAIDAIRPSQYQPRRTFDEVSLQELAQSIQQQGLLQPIVVRSLENDTYELLAGERRWRACQLAGMTELPAIVKTVTEEEAMVIALVENLQRQDLNVMEQARGMHRLAQTFSLTHQQIAQTLSKSRSAVTNVLRLLSLSRDVQHLLEEGDIDMGHARALLMLEESKQVAVANEIVSRALSVRATESLVNRIQSAEEVLPTTPIKAIHPYQQRLMESLKTKIEIKPARKRGAGKLIIHYDSEKKLEEIVGFALT